MLYQSKNGRYRVEVAADGGVRVKPGDWLSKYSAAIHKNYYTINVFYRKTRSGNLERLANPNLIYAGETLYHLPTFKKAREITFDKSVEIIGVNVPVLSDTEKKKLTLEHLKKEFNLRGQHLPVVSKAIDIIGYTGDALAVAEVAGLISGTGGLAAAGTAFSIAGIFLFPIGGVIALVNAAETGYRHFGMRAVAYATTAWAFGDPIPGPPAWMRAEISSAMVQKAIQADPRSRRLYERAQAGDKDKITAMHKAWNDAARATVKNLDAEVIKRKVQKTSYQVLLRAIGNNDHNTLSITLMKELEKSLSAGSERKAYWAPAPRYPNE